MPTVIVNLSVSVTLDVPQAYAAQVTREDLILMAQSGCPDSSVHPGPPSGTQIVVEEVCQEETGLPVFADVFVEHGCGSDPELEFLDAGFTAADSDL